MGVAKDVGGAHREGGAASPRQLPAGGAQLIGLRCGASAVPGAAVA